MESVHGVDVSWMAHSSNSSQKDHHSRPQAPPHPASPEKPASAHNGDHPQPKEPATPSSKPTPNRPGFTRTSSTEKTATLNGGSKPVVSPPTRRNSWLSSISSRFSSPGQHGHSSPTSSPQGSSPDLTQEPPVPTGPYSPKNAILPHATKGAGDEPYIPAPPKSGQTNFLQSALRRLSSSSSSHSGHLANAAKGVQHGLCERRVLNVDRNRERCRISELDQSKLRRVAFCVDVEVASGPRYTEDVTESLEDTKEKRDLKRMTEKGEGVALKHPEAVKNEKEEADASKGAGEQSSRETMKETSKITAEAKDSVPTAEKDMTKKKEKKKRSEEERKARKEKKRRMAEENGTLPVELIREDEDESTSTSSTPAPGTPRSQLAPTTDPVRIYRRCCQLRETPVLKRIIEELTASCSTIGQPGVISKLDLTGYWLELSDFITLGDYLAVVPVKELVLENCGLTDEGVRVVLAGLLAAKPTDYPTRRRRKFGHDGEVRQGGIVERLVLKNNVKIGRDGWRHICLFINMCRSLKSLDLSNVPFPQSPPQSPSHGQSSASPLSRTTSSSKASGELSSLLSKAISERLAGKELELLNVSKCGFTTQQLGDLVDGIIKSGLRRLGLAGNKISPEGMNHVARYIREGSCEGLDLGGNDLADQLGTIADALNEGSNLYALSLADCNLNPESLWALFPALTRLENFRFIDLSQNHALFDTDPSALSLLRRYLPKMPILKRIHFTDVSMTPEQAIALAEILPDTPSLAHVNLMENPKLAALADAKDEANQEEACALYASLMAAVRVSKTIVCIDIEVPSNDSSEIVKALAKQVVAYCLWNMEHGPVAEISPAVATPESDDGDNKEVAMPEVLLHLVGRVEGLKESHEDDDYEPAPDEDYMIGGTGVVKALGICLRNRGNDSRRPSMDRTFSDRSEPGSGTAAPRTRVSGGKAKQMSKNLLGSARKIRARLQPALVKEARTGDRNNYQRLLFLDQTLKGMIKRFEDEFPETRLPTANASSSSTDLTNSGDAQGSDTEQALVDTNEGHLSDDEFVVRPVLSRHNSDVSIASKALSQEEGRMHRFNQKFRRDILMSDGSGEANGPTDQDEYSMHLQALRSMLEDLGGEQIRAKLEREGQDAVLDELRNEASSLRKQIIDADPEGWKKFVESQEAAQMNLKAEVRGPEREYS